MGRQAQEAWRADSGDKRVLGVWDATEGTLKRTWKGATTEGYSPVEVPPRSGQPSFHPQVPHRVALLESVA